VSYGKVAFNYLRENYTQSGQPIVHGLVNFKPELVPDIPSGKFSGQKSKNFGYLIVDWAMVHGCMDS